MGTVPMPLARAKPQPKQPKQAGKALAQATQGFEAKPPKLESGDLGKSGPEWPTPASSHARRGRTRGESEAVSSTTVGRG